MSKHPECCIKDCPKRIDLSMSNDPELPDEFPKKLNIKLTSCDSKPAMYENLVNLTVSEQASMDPDVQKCIETKLVRETDPETLRGFYEWVAKEDQIEDKEAFGKTLFDKILELKQHDAENNKRIAERTQKLGARALTDALLLQRHAFAEKTRERIAVTTAQYTELINEIKKVKHGVCYRLLVDENSPTEGGMEEEGKEEEVLEDASSNEEEEVVKPSCSTAELAEEVLEEDSKEFDESLEEENELDEEEDEVDAEIMACSVDGVDCILPDEPGFEWPPELTSKRLRCENPLCRKKESKKNRFSGCSRCRRVVYCSKACQLEHWHEHKKVCIEWLW